MNADFFGGTFDPPHEGHLEVIRAYLTSDRVLVVCPTEQNPWKEIKPTPLRIRREMLRLALEAEGIPYSLEEPCLGKVFISTIPYQRSVEMLRYWRNMYGGELRWIIAEDIRESYKSWLNWETEGCPVTIAKINYPYHSTDVRTGKVAPLASIKGYIESQNLYR